MVGGPAPEEYVGFVGQIQRGWDAMVAVASGAILLLGVMLPWLGAVAVLGAIVYGIVRWSQAGRVTPPDEPAPPPSDEQESVHQ
jgi:hypothetical protein